MLAARIHPSKALQAPAWVTAIVPHHPNTDVVLPDVVKKMIRKTVEVAAS